MANYGSTTGVQALLPVLGTLSGSTTPTSTQVSTWLEEGAAVINRSIATAGYTVPVASSATCYAELTSLNKLYAGAYCLIARGLDAVSGGEETRSQQWLDRFNAQLNALVSSNLAALGCTIANTPASSNRPRLRTTQVKRVDGYSAVYEDDTDLDN